MPARKARQPVATGGEDAGERDERLEAFCAGLHPILVDGDEAAFRRYLAQWEDVIGDCAELAETPIEQQRKTMAALLRRPQQFNLPRWKQNGAVQANHALEPAAPLGWDRAAPPGADEEPPAGAFDPERDHEAESAWPQTEARVDPLTEAGGHRAAAQTHGGQTEASAALRCAYQLDMLTGELVPVNSVRSEPPPHEAPGEPAPRVRKRRPRRHRASNLAQLAFWPEAAPLSVQSPSRSAEQ